MHQLQILNKDAALSSSQEKILSLITDIIANTTQKSDIFKIKKLRKSIKQQKDPPLLRIQKNDFKISPIFFFFFWLVLCHKPSELNKIFTTKIAMQRDAAQKPCGTPKLKRSNFSLLLSTRQRIQPSRSSPKLFTSLSTIILIRY